jgi:PKD domain/Subtilase family
MVDGRRDPGADAALGPGPTDLRPAYTHSMQVRRSTVARAPRACTRRIGLGVACATLTWSLCVAATASASHPVSPARTRHAQIRAICRPPKPGHTTCTALLRSPVSTGSTPTSSTAAATTYTVNDGASSSGPAGGLTPEQLASAYAYDPTAGGAGQTVAIVDAFDDPTIEHDLAEFDGHYGLAPCTSANGCFEKVGQAGSPEKLPRADTTAWSVEISLDVETVHAVCPNCKVLLVEANEPSYRDLAVAVNQAVSMGATEVSNSYAGAESGQGEAEQAAYSHPGVVIAAAAGDDGYDGWDVVNKRKAPAEMPDTPSSLPSVVAVGGTSLELNADGTRAQETVWNENGPGDSIGLRERRAKGATGGGCSTLFTAPAWQLSAAGFAATGCGSKRLVADISAVGDPDTGFDVFDTYDCGAECKAFGIGNGSGWLTLGGTSLSTPLITSLYALAGGDVGIEDSALPLYGHLGDPSVLFDVTEGGNSFCDAQPLVECEHPKAPNSRFGHVDCEASSACNAAPGLDGPSGVGVPNGLGAFKTLLPTAAIAAPGSVLAGAPAAFGAGGSSDPYPGGSIVSYSWTWGDGGSGSSPAHTFATPGTYDVTLVVTDNYGLRSAATTHSILVSAPSPAEETTAEEKRREEEAAVAIRAEEEATLQRTEQEARQGAQGLGPSAGSIERVPLTANLQEVAAFHAAAVPAIPDAELVGRALSAGPSGRVVLTVSCPPRESSCQGTVTLRTLGAARAGSVSSGKLQAGALTLAGGSFTVPGGTSRKVTLRLSAKARALLAHSRSLRVQVRIAAHDPAGARHTARTLAMLRSIATKHGSG